MMLLACRIFSADVFVIRRFLTFVFVTYLYICNHNVQERTEACEHIEIYSII